MGDILTPRRRDVVDRLRRRIEFYRRRQNGIQQRYEFGQKATYEAERQHALSLRQKWLESKAKKSSKKSKSDSSHPDLRNPSAAKRPKHKLDNTSSLEANPHQSHADNVYRFDDDDAQTSKTVSTTNSANIEGLSSSVSVHIVHNINGASVQSDQKISTNVTVNQTFNKSKADSASDLHSNIECKTEPNEDGANGSNTNNDDLDTELDDILLSFRNEDLTGDIIDELNKFEEICRNVHKDSERSDSGLNKTPTDSGSMFASSMYSDPSQGQGQVRTPPVPPYTGRGSHPHTSLSEGGLAAETLKQLAAQHQQQQHPGQDNIGVKTAIDPFSDLSESGQYSARNGYTPPDYYSGMSSGPYSGQGSMGYPSKQQSMSSSYGPSNNKLAHYAHTPTSQADAAPSSLQQLQNQVAHFNQGPQMEITQTQHMQVSDGVQRMQMSQTQHVAVRQPLQNISLTQQQGFSTSPNMGQTPSQSQNFMSGDQMTMQQQMMQTKMHHDPRQTQAAQAHMQQYMNRPPPEYKMQHANGMSGNMPGSAMSGSAMSGSGMGGANPLQTIQNMVNQTNTHPNHAYSSVKSESNELQNGMRNGQMSISQQHISSTVNPGMAMSQAQSVYSNQSLQRQGSFPGVMSHQMAGRSQRPNGPTYTSAIMRNQRPPNVNIGPDGLNISQPRHPQEWPRGMNPASMQGTRPAAPATSASMMHARSYTTDAAQMQMHQGQRSMHMDSMHSQQAAMMQGNAHAQQQQMMMQQQQRIHMSQQMGQRSHSNAYMQQYNMAAQTGSYPQTNTSQDDLLSMLDAAPNQSTDFFDVNTSTGVSDANWDDFEYILNSK